MRSFVRGLKPVAIGASFEMLTREEAAYNILAELRKIRDLLEKLT